MASTALMRTADVGSSGPWVRDLCLVGGATGIGAPLAALTVLGLIHDPAASLFLAVSGTLGLTLGAVLGRATPALMRWRLGRLPRIAFLATAVGVGALCGIVVGGIAGEVAMGGRTWLATALFAAPVGAVQLGWFWLAAAQRRVRRRSVGGMLVAAAVAAPALGLGLMRLLQAW